MAAITPTVYLVLPQQTAGLDTAALEFGDATTGKFGTGKFAAGGSVSVDISNDVQSVQIRRGRSRALDRPEAGTCTLTLRNDRVNAGDYDPQNTAGAYYPWLAAQAVQIQVVIDTSYVLFTGWVSDITVEEDVPRLSMTTIAATDAISRLAADVTLLPAYQEKAGTMIGRVIDSVTDGILYSTESGVVEVPSTGFGSPYSVIPISGNAQDIIGDLERTEGGLFYCTAEGALTFSARSTLVGASPPITFSDATSATYPYSRITRASIGDAIYNSITVTAWTNATTDGFYGTETSIRADTASISRYGRRSYTLDSAYCNRLGDSTHLGTDDIADLILTDYSAPPAVVQSIVVPLMRYTTAHQHDVLGFEQGDVFTVTRTAPGASTVTANYMIVGIEHSIALKEHWLTFQLAPQPTATFPSLPR